jgi:hypothetical protein
MVEGTNLYEYARNNPVRFVDPLGMDTDDSTARKAIDLKDLQQKFRSPDFSFKERLKLAKEYNLKQTQRGELTTELSKGASDLLQSSTANKAYGQVAEYTKGTLTLIGAALVFSLSAPLIGFGLYYFGVAVIAVGKGAVAIGKGAGDIGLLAAAGYGSYRLFKNDSKGQISSFTDKALVQRTEQLHRELIARQLEQRGIQPTDKQFGKAKSYGTISMVQTEINGQTTRIVTTNNPQLYSTLKQFQSRFLQEGETLGSPPTAVYGPERGKRQYIHAEQIGVQDAIAKGAKEGTIATSNAGCKDLCISLLKEYFPTFRHVNPAKD